MNITEFSIRNPLICWIVIAIALIGGYLAYGKMARFEDPEFTIRTAKIVTQYPGASPLEVMNEVTEPIETAIQQLPEVKSVESTSTAGLSEVSVDIFYNSSKTRSDLQIVWTKLRNKVNDAQLDLPPGSQTSIVNDDFGDVFGIYYLITGDGFTPPELLSYAKSLRKNILLIDGVAKVSIIGEQDEAIYVEISRERASSLGVSLDEIYATLTAQNSVTSAGRIDIGNSRIEIDPTGAIDSVEAIEGLVIGDSQTGGLTRLGAIAEVTRGYKEPATKYIRYDGQLAIGLGISNIAGANVVKIGDAVDAKLAELEELRPGGIIVHEFYHQGKVVNESIEGFVSNVVSALLIVFFTLLVFMGFKSGVIMGLTVLITMAATLLCMWLAGIPMHRISLGALIISLGMLVDNGVVVTDGILVGVKEGKKKLDVAKEVARKNMKPLLGGTLVGVIAFAPIGFAPGDTAEYTNALFWVVMIALAFSWLFAFTLTPLFCYWAFPQVVTESDSSVERKESVFMQGYKAVINWVLQHKLIALVATLGVFLFSMWGFQFVKVGFFPASTTPQVIVDYYLPEGISIQKTRKDMIRLEDYVRQLDGVTHVKTLIGGSGLRYKLVYDVQADTTSYGQLLVKTSDYRQNDHIISEIQTHANLEFPEGLTKAWKFQQGPGGGSKIEASFSGSDAKVLRRLVNEAKAIMVADPGAILIKDDWRRQVPIIEPVFSVNKGERVGITRQDLAEALEENFNGVQRGVYREGDDLIPIISRAPERERREPWNITSIPILSNTAGGTVPMAQVLDNVQIVWRNSKILRTDRILTIKAQCDPGIGVITDDLLARLRLKIEAIELPDGYYLKWDGEYGDSAEAQQSLASTIPLGFLAMVLVVVLVFNALRQPVVIWAIVPLAIVGVTFGLIVTQTPFEFMGILGLLSLSGLLIQNSLVLVDSTDELIASGMPRFEALVESAVSRLRPVTMGAFTTVLGVLPLYFDAFFRSMTVVLAFGLSFATIITLLVTPVLYALIFRINADEVSVSTNDAAQERVESV